MGFLIPTYQIRIGFLYVGFIAIKCKTNTENKANTYIEEYVKCRQMEDDEIIEIKIQFVL